MTERYTFTIPSVPPSLNEYKRMSMFPAARAQTRAPAYMPSAGSALPVATSES